MDTYIENLAKNYVIPIKTIEIDFGIGWWGIQWFLSSWFKLIKELENRKYLKVNRISGVSVGAVLGFIIYPTS